MRESGPSTASVVRSKLTCESESRRTTYKTEHLQAKHRTRKQRTVGIQRANGDQRGRMQDEHKRCVRDTLANKTATK